MRLDWCCDATWLVIAGRVAIDTSDLHGSARVRGMCDASSLKTGFGPQTKAALHLGCRGSAKVGCIHHSHSPSPCAISLTTEGHFGGENASRLLDTHRRMSEFWSAN